MKVLLCWDTGDGARLNEVVAEMKTAPQEWLVAAFLWPQQQDMKSLCHNGLFLFFLLSSQGAEIIPTCISNMHFS